MNRLSARSELFIKTVAHVIGIEGGYVNDPRDAGGETKFGISKRQYPHIDIPSLTFEDAADIYWEDYWRPARCDVLPPALAIFLFDCRVNHRPKTASRLLQLGLGVTADGKIGPQTLLAANSVADVEYVLGMALAHRAKLYHRLVVANSSQSAFILGWFRRLFDLQQFILNTTSKDV